MRATLKTSIELKDTTFYPKGIQVDVEVDERAPTIAIVTVQGRKFRMKSRNLWKYMEEFEEISFAELERNVLDSVCPSLLGYMVEPDGWDEMGFPSKLLAVGCC